MLNFQYYTPTKVVFGKDAELKVGSLVKAEECKKVLVLLTLVKQLPMDLEIQMLMYGICLRERQHLRHVIH